MEEQKLATRNKQIGSYSGGIEGLLSGFAITFLSLGLLGAGLSFIVAFRSDPVDLFWAMIGIAMLLQGLFLYAITEAGANTIRLLKKQNGLPYGGKISEVEPVYIYACSECGAAAEEYQSCCYACNAVFPER